MQVFSAALSIVVMQPSPSDTHRSRPLVQPRLSLQT
jgi:hypothetical protein